MAKYYRRPQTDLILTRFSPTHGDAVMSRRRAFSSILSLALLLVASDPVTAGQKPKAPRPNIVFILVDDLRWDDLACMGHPFVGTPNIDRIAREGALFKNAYATTPLCSPSRASISVRRLISPCIRSLSPRMSKLLRSLY